MKLRSKLMMFTAALALSTGMAAAAITGTGVLTKFQSEGYTYIEVKEGLTQIKVEAVRGTSYIEVIYDKATGAVIKTESGTASAEDAVQTGTSVRIVNRDFEDGDDQDDAGEVDEDDDDANDDDDDGDDNDEDDNGEDEDDNDEDENDNDEDENDEDEDDSDEDDSDEDDDDNSGGNGSGGDDDDCDN